MLETLFCNGLYNFCVSFSLFSMLNSFFKNKLKNYKKNNKFYISAILAFSYIFLSFAKC